MTIYAYTRVSTDEQDHQSQTHRINEYCANNGLKINSWVNETISSRKEDREIYELIESFKPGDMLIVTELSRLGRSSVTEIFKIIGIIREKKAGLRVIQDSIEIDGGEMSIQAEMMVSILSIASRLERDLNSERTKAGIAKAKAKGVKMGRPEGYSVLAGREDEVEKYFAMKLNKTSIATLMGVSRATIYAYIKKKEKSKGQVLKQPT